MNIWSYGFNSFCILPYMKYIVGHLNLCICFMLLLLMYGPLKEQFTQRYTFCRPLLTHMLIQTCITFFCETQNNIFQKMSQCVFCQYSENVWINSAAIYYKVNFKPHCFLLVNTTNSNWSRCKIKIPDCTEYNWNFLILPVNNLTNNDKCERI